MGVISMRDGDPEAAAGWFSRDAGSRDRGIETYLAALALPGLGAALLALGRRDEAAATLDQAVAVARRLAMPAPLAEALDGQAELAVDHADGFENSLDLAHRALAERADHGLRGYIADSLEAVARSGTLVNPTADDVRLLAAADAARRALGLPRGAHRQPMFEETVARLRTSLGEAFQEAWAEGSGLDLDEAVAYARRSRGARGRPATGWASLMPTELEVVHLVVAGLNNPEIGTRLFMSRGTVKTHLGHIFAKLDVSNRTELASVATGHGI
jgi:DNA-binding CsgD family transcriptional regulator